MFVEEPIFWTHGWPKTDSVKKKLRRLSFECNEPTTIDDSITLALSVLPDHLVLLPMGIRSVHIDALFVTSHDLYNDLQKPNA